MNRSEKNNMDSNMNRRNLFKTLGKGILALTAIAVPGFAAKQLSRVQVKIHPDAVKRNSGGKN